MDAKKQDATTAVSEFLVDASKGTERLQLSISRMKRLHSGVAGGLEQQTLEPGSPAGKSWMRGYCL